MASVSDVLNALQSSARNGTLLSSCEPEVKELMHQLDVIISAKQREWEGERRAIQIELDHKQRELAILQRDVLKKNSEIEQLKVMKRSIEQEYHVKHADQEAQLLRVRSELKRLHQSYEQLKKKKSHNGRSGEESCKQQCQRLQQQVSELREGMALLEQQLRRREREMSVLEEDREQKISILQESLLTKDELIRTMEEQMNLARTSVQFSSYGAELNQLREALRENVEEKEGVRRELERVRQEQQTKMKENTVITELQERVERLETQLREAQSQKIHEEDNYPLIELQDNTVIGEFVNHVDELVSGECVTMSPDTEPRLSQALEGILDKHFNQLDTSLQAILSSN